MTTIKNKYLRALFFSGVIYDEKNFKKKVLRFFPNAIIKTFENGTDFFAVVLFDSLLYIVVRGTGGTTLKKLVKAWLSNFKLKIDEDGFHTDFHMCGKDIFKTVLDCIRKMEYNKIFIVGHSRGGGITPVIGYYLNELYMELFEGIVFGAPPTVNKEGLGLLNNLLRKGCKFTHVVNPGDMMTVLFRSGANEYVSGCDFGTRFVLPSDNWFQRIKRKISRWFFSALEHSPREYCDGYKTLYRKNKPLLKVVKLIRNSFVN